MDTEFCELCDNEAIYYYDNFADRRVYLCGQCKDAFEYGQNNPAATVYGIDDEEEEA